MSKAVSAVLSLCRPQHAWQNGPGQVNVCLALFLSSRDTKGWGGGPQRENTDLWAWRTRGCFCRSYRGQNLLGLHSHPGHSQLPLILKLSLSPFA